ncbi:4Fe-4S binding protein [Propionivibrio sp.]|uniref:4Fe-4S binding protein n=1 Tax=Propionivibrio sp. TaxID=2212460 RepID=UPI003BF276C2
MLCIQCGQCSNVCPHSVIRAKIITKTSFLALLPVSSRRRSMRGAMGKSTLPLIPF